MKLTQYRIYHITDEGNKYSVVLINDSGLSLEQKVQFNEIDGEYYIYRIYGTFDSEKIEEEIKDFPVYTLKN